MAGIGRVVVDNFHELEMLQQVASARGVRQDILLRLSPGIAAHTHRLITTGIVDSKFGFYMGQAADAVARALTLGALNLVGFHCHIGSQIHEVQPYLDTIGVMLDFAAEMRDAHGLELEELDIGGGIAIRYTGDDPALPLVVGVISSLGGGVRFYRTIMVEEVNRDYVRTARAKGIGEIRIMFKHVLKNGMLPILTSLVMQIPFLFLGSLLLENFFGIPGLGSMTFDAIQLNDFATLRVMVFIGAVIFVIGQVLTDISYSLVDPRVRLS